MIMSRLTGFFILAAVFLSCSRELDEAAIGNSAGNSPAEETVSHGLIVLGDRLENPYTTENIRDAYVSLYPTKSRNEIETTHLYVRFLPGNETEFDLLASAGLDLVDYPLDYEILVDGDYYHDPSIEEDNITWQYAVVPAGFEFPDIRYEIIDECFITENDPVSRASDDGIDWDAVEEQAFRITGNGALLQPGARGSRTIPSGRITIVDEKANGGKPFGVAGVRVRCNSFVKFASAYTDRDGYYTIPVKFSARLKYRLVFKNTKGFAIGFNLILVPASTSSLGRGPASGKNYTITKDSDRKLFLRAAVNNAAYDYISRCSADDMNLTLPPGDLRIWLMSSLSASSAVMIHHKVAVSHPLISDFLGVFASIIAFFAPDVTVGTADMDDYDDVYRAVCHELAHCSHFSQVGKDYWNRYVEYILRSYLKSGGSAYGDGTGEYAGYCEIGEMWAYYLESVMYQERYGGSLPQFGTGYWFSPQIFRYLDDRGFSRSDFLAAMKSYVTSIDLLRDKLTASFPDKGEMINQVFLRYN